MSFAFTGELNEQPKPTASDDAADAAWWPVDELPSMIAFDHAQIIADALTM